MDPDARQGRPRRLPAGAEPQQRCARRPESAVSATGTTRTSPSGCPDDASGRRGRRRYYTIASLVQDYLVKSGELLDAQPVLVHSIQRVNCAASGDGTTHYSNVDRGGAARARAERPRQRPGRHRLPLRRRGEHVATLPAELLSTTPPIASIRVARASTPRPREGRRARSSTRSATTSTAGERIPRSAEPDPSGT